MVKYRATWLNINKEWEKLNEQCCCSEKVRAKYQNLINSDPGCVVGSVACLCVYIDSAGKREFIASNTVVI